MENIKDFIYLFYILRCAQNILLAKYRKSERKRLKRCNEPEKGKSRNNYSWKTTNKNYTSENLNRSLYKSSTLKSCIHGINHQKVILRYYETYIEKR